MISPLSQRSLQGTLQAAAFCLGRAQGSPCPMRRPRPHLQPARPSVPALTAPTEHTTRKTAVRAKNFLRAGGRFYHALDFRATDDSSVARSFFHATGDSSIAQPFFRAPPLTASARPADRRAACGRAAAATARRPRKPPAPPATRPHSADSAD